MRRDGTRSSEGFTSCILTYSRRIAEEYEVMMVERFNDAVCSAPELRYDVVIDLASWVTALYDPDDFQRVIRVKSTISGDPRSMMAKEITCFIKPEKMFKIPALKESELKNFDRLSEKLDNINKIVLHRLSLVDRCIKWKAKHFSQALESFY